MMIILIIVKFFLQFWPFKFGKQTFAHHFFLKFLRNSSLIKDIQHRGIRYRIHMKDRIQAIFFLTGLYEPETVKICTQVLKPDSTYIDIGGNVGLIYLQISAHIKNMRAHLFEPDPDVFKMLTTNIKLNPNQDVQLNNLAVSESSSQSLKFFKSLNSDESGWGRLENSENKNEKPENFVTVKTVSLDEYVEKNNIIQIDLLKMDVEGAEENVLKGADKCFKKKIIKAIVCEINEPALQSFNSSKYSVLTILEKNGFQLARQAELNYFFVLK